MVEQQIDSILFMLPENERNTVKSFLLMQHERIESLESLYTKIIDDVWNDKFIIKNLKEDQLKYLSELLYKKDQNIEFCCILYNQDTNDIYIKFNGIRCKTFVNKWLHSGK